VDVCIEYIEQYGIKEPNLFVQPKGNRNKAKKLQEELEDPRCDPLKLWREKVPVKIVCGALLQYMRLIYPTLTVTPSSSPSLLDRSHLYLAIIESSLQI